MQTHKLKTHSEYWHEVARGNKSFEIRKDDRGFEVGDTLKLYEVNSETLNHVGGIITTKVIYILRNESQFGLQPGYCILGLGDITVTV